MSEPRLCCGMTKAGKPCRIAQSFYGGGAQAMPYFFCGRHKSQATPAQRRANQLAAEKMEAKQRQREIGWEMRKLPRVDPLARRQESHHPVGYRYVSRFEGGSPNGCIWCGSAASDEWSRFNFALIPEDAVSGSGWYRDRYKYESACSCECGNQHEVTLPADCVEFRDVYLCRPCARFIRDASRQPLTASWQMESWRQPITLELLDEIDDAVSDEPQAEDAPTDAELALAMKRFLKKFDLQHGARQQ